MALIDETSHLGLWIWPDGSHCVDSDLAIVKPISGVYVGELDLRPYTERRALVGVSDRTVGGSRGLGLQIGEGGSSRRGLCPPARTSTVSVHD